MCDNIVTKVVYKMNRQFAQLEAFCRSRIFRNKLIAKYGNCVYCDELTLVYYDTVKCILTHQSIEYDSMLRQILEEICPKSERKKKGKKRMTVRRILFSV